MLIALLILSYALGVILGIIGLGYGNAKYFYGSLFCWIITSILIGISIEVI